MLNKYTYFLKAEKLKSGIYHLKKFAALTAYFLKIIILNLRNAEKLTDSQRFKEFKSEKLA